MFVTTFFSLLFCCKFFIFVFFIIKGYRGQSQGLARQHKILTCLTLTLEEPNKPNRYFKSKSDQKTMKYQVLFWFKLSQQSQQCTSNIRQQVLCNEILTLSQMTNFRLFQTERVCRQQF